MKNFINQEIKGSCHSCQLRTENFFCHLSPPNLQILQSLKITHTYGRGTTLFFEGQESNGIYMLCRGRVKLSASSRDGRVVILRIAEAGEVLGLSATVSDSAYEASAEIIEPSQVNFIRKGDFLRFLRENAEASLCAAKQLCQVCDTAYDQIRSLALSNSVADKLAKLFVGWCKTSGMRTGVNGSVRVKMTYTHEEIAEMIGTSRETVSRLLKEFKDKNLITLRGADLIIHDQDRLEAGIGNARHKRI
jgi:CRP/FNR family transcriptional regulator